MQFNGCSIMTGWDFANKAEFPALDLHDGGTGSDTWYPYWGADGRWYSTFTDGTVGGVHAQSGGQNPSMHGQVVVEPAGGLGTGKRLNFVVLLWIDIPDASRRATSGAHPAVFKIR